jgi:hypothetical protein
VITIGVIRPNFPTSPKPRPTHKQLKLTLTLSSILGIFALTGCVYQEGYGYYGSQDSIWAENSPRYGRAEQPAQAERYERSEPTEAPARASNNSPYRTYTGPNRYGASQDRRFSQQYAPGAPARLSGTTETSRPPQNPTPPRNSDRDADDRPSQPGGFNRATTEPRNENLASVPPPAPAPAPEKKPAPPSDQFSHLPFAVPVPGKAGYVKLPGHAGLPEIDVRGMAPGTPVEIPNPAQPGKTIQFRVP